MLLWLTHYLMHYMHAFRVFQYLSFRSIVSALTAFFIAFLCSPKFIKKLVSLQIGQSVRNDGPQTHLQKAGTPTMGGTLILIAITISILLWGDLTNRFIWILLFTTLTFGFIGWIDDYLKVIKKNSRGLSAKRKFFLQTVLGAFIAVVLYATATTRSNTELVIPFITSVLPNLGLFYILLAYLFIVGSSNAVNLTDGLDGLALMPMVLITMALGVFAYLAGNDVFADYLRIPYVPGAGEVAVFCSALAGAGLGFLWYNTYPAQVFMGDVGSLGLGAALGVVAVIVRQELIFLLMAGVFVAETASVILQVASFKLTGKRLFKMAPLHHHFELKGWPEPRVIVRFWIVTVILVLLGLATLKLR